MLDNPISRSVVDLALVLLRNFEVLNEAGLGRVLHAAVKDVAHLGLAFRRLSSQRFGAHGLRPGILYEVDLA